MSDANNADTPGQATADARHSGGESLVGRDDELRRIGDLVTGARAGRGHLMLISGEAGIGKTALVRELVRQAEQVGFRVLRGHCYDLGLTPPYGPWREALAVALPTGQIAPGASWISSDPAAIEVNSQGPLFERIDAEFRGLGGSRPLLIVLEDLHSADDASLMLLRHLAHRIEHAPILIAATYRDDELGRDTLLYRLLPRLVREAPVARFELRRLTVDDVDELVHSRYSLPGPDAERLVDLLRRYTDGIPLFVEELLRTLERDAFVRQEPGGWRFREQAVAPVAAGSMPLLLRQIIEDRLASLSEAVRQDLRVAAVIGEHVSFDLWLEVLGTSEELLGATLEQALEHRILQEAPGGDRLQFRHALIREALYGELIQPRRREWHRRVADGLLRHSEPDPDRVSFHLQEAGDPRAASWLVQAAERAIRDYSPIAATERLRVAVAAMEAAGVRTSELGWYLLKLGSMSREFLPLDETDAYLDRALEIATATNDRLLEVNVTWARGTNRCYQGRNGLGYMRQALDSGSDLDFEARTREPMRLLQGEAIAPGVLAVWAALFGDYRQAFQAASDQFAGPSQNTFRSRFGTAFGHGGRAYAYAALGRPEEARREFHALQETFQELRHSWAQAVHYYGEYIAVAIPYYTDDRQYREWLAAQIQPRWRDHVSGASPLPQLYGLIPALLHEGRWDEVHDLTLDRVSGASTYDYFGLYALGTVVRFRGRPGLAWRQVRAGVPEGPASPPDGTLRIETQLLQELAVELALDANDLYLARSWLDAHGRWLGPAEGEHSQIARRADGLLLQARLLQRFGDIDGARALAESALDRATEPRQPLALLRAHRVLGSWRTDSRAFEAARDHLATSAHIARAAAIPHELAQTLLVQADLEAAAGQSAGAQTLLRQAAEIVDRMDLALLRLDLQRIERTVSSTGSQRVVPALLTPRELEVLRHIVEGSSNRDIAGALSLSVRTIERHISNIYNKTGIQGRAAITAYALRREII